MRRLPTSHEAIPLSERRKVRTLTPRMIDWFARSARDLPWRRTHDPYAIWVSEIMLQQTQVKTVIPYYERWMKALPTVQTAARASSQRLHKLWEGLGYYTRVRNMQKAAQIVCSEHRGRFPHQFEDLLSLPGIGRYTAGAICSIAFNQPTPILDGNVMRVLTRVFGIVDDPRQTVSNAHLWGLAEGLVQRATCCTPQRDACSHLNQSLMELGATICTARSPECPSCPIRRSCVAQRDGRVQELPAIRNRPQMTRKQIWVFAIQNRNQLWLIRQPSKKGESGLWEFPSIEVKRANERPALAARRAVPFQHTKLVKLITFKHSITRYLITFAAYSAEISTRPDPDDARGRWVPISRLSHMPLPAAHRRIADAFREANKRSKAPRNASTPA